MQKGKIMYRTFHRNENESTLFHNDNDSKGESCYSLTLYDDE
jgi:hypothetical protein